MATYCSLIPQLLNIVVNTIKGSSQLQKVLSQVSLHMVGYHSYHHSRCTAHQGDSDYVSLTSVVETAVNSIEWLRWNDVVDVTYDKCDVQSYLMVGINNNQFTISHIPT